jgi:hypothetical protein
LRCRVTIDSRILRVLCGLQFPFDTHDYQNKERRAKKLSLTEKNTNESTRGAGEIQYIIRFHCDALAVIFILATRNSRSNAFIWVYARTHKPVRV